MNVYQVCREKLDFTREQAAETDEDRSIFLKVLDKFFDGKKDTRTLEILKQIGE